MPRKPVRWVLAIALAAAGVAGLYLGYRALIGWPATPMTVSQADSLFARGLPPGQSIEDAEAWLATQGILPTSAVRSFGIGYDILRRRDDVTFKGRWMDCRGNQTVAECAGLSVDDVYTVLRVFYPEADRFFLGVTSITVYLFFDDHGRLIRHWVDEFHVMP